MKDSNREKIYIGIIIFLAMIALHFAVKATQEIEIRFSQPVYPAGNFTKPERFYPVDQKF